MHLPILERLVLVATATTIVLDGHMPVRNDKPEDKSKIKVKELIAKDEKNEAYTSVEPEPGGA